MINGGYRPSTTSFDDSFTFTLYQETGRQRSPTTSGRRHLRGRSHPRVEDLALGVISHFASTPRHRDVTPTA